MPARKFRGEWFNEQRSIANEQKKHHQQQQRELRGGSPPPPLFFALLCSMAYLLELRMVHFGLSPRKLKNIFVCDRVCPPMAHGLGVQRPIISFPCTAPRERVNFRCMHDMHNAELQEQEEEEKRWHFASGSGEDRISYRERSDCLPHCSSISCRSFQHTRLTNRSWRSLGPVTQLLPLCATDLWVPTVVLLSVKEKEKEKISEKDAKVSQPLELGVTHKKLEPISKHPVQNVTSIKLPMRRGTASPTV